MSAVSQSSSLSHEAWLAKLAELAAERDLSWAVCTAPGGHREAYEQGLSPEEVLAPLADMAQWRGCACGGGGG
ncbi:MAG: hypothetical protein RBS40_06425 [Rhodocyclaceae bacterium]|jgi:hypothetical protein|nr:hypothetical protein [Rhodocyclaceae bacterium]